VKFPHEIVYVFDCVQEKGRYAAGARRPAGQRDDQRQRLDDANDRVNLMTFKTRVRPCSVSLMPSYGMMSVTSNK